MIYIQNIDILNIISENNYLLRQLNAVYYFIDFNLNVGYNQGNLEVFNFKL